MPPPGNDWRQSTFGNNTIAVDGVRQHSQWAMSQKRFIREETDPLHHEEIRFRLRRVQGSGTESENRVPLRYGYSERRRCGVIPSRRIRYAYQRTALQPRREKIDTQCRARFRVLDKIARRQALFAALAPAAIYSTIRVLSCSTIGSASSLAVSVHSKRASLGAIARKTIR